MSVPREKQRFRWMSVREKVSTAYHDYGRLCSAHPIACLSMSLLTMLVLSYPAVSRLRLPVSTPIDVFWSENIHVKESSAPLWINDNPAAYIQQFVVSATVNPWNASAMTPEQAVRGSLSTAFRIRDIVLSEPSIDEVCLRLTAPNASPWPFRSKSSCVVLSPASVWYNDLQRFKEDEDVVRTILNEQCDATMCLRDAMLGAPMSATGIKPRFDTNRKRDIQYAVTIFFARYNNKIILSLKERLGKEFKVLESTANDDKTFVQVYFHPLKTFSDYLPLISTYLLCMVYLYFSSRKFEMVASRWGLAFAASFTVAATLLMTTGICAHLDLSTTLWGAELYPYIALILGLENILCITRSVVYTPPSLDVSSRIAHGLSQEGYKLTKYFLLELICLICGYLTRVSDIQEFCQFSVICIVVDFYMQLFFYAPCLTFDLQRLGLEEKRRFAEILFSAEIPRLKNYAPVSCPMRKVWPKLFELKNVHKRRLSDSGIAELFADSNKEQKRPLTSADWSDDTKIDGKTSGGASDATSSSHRLRILYFITRTRIIQRTIMVVFAIWVAWIAFFVHSRHAVDVNIGETPTIQSEARDATSHRLLSAANLKYGQWQRRTYKWWPSLAHNYNISLASRYVTFLPPIVVQATVSAEDSILKHVPPIVHVNKTTGAYDEITASETPVLRSRIDWLEMQLKMYLAAFWLLLLTTVATFFVYVCFKDRWKFGIRRVKEANVGSSSSDSMLSSPGRAFFEPLPIVFAAHRFPIETIGIDVADENGQKNRFLSCCQEGHVFVWNSDTGERTLRLNRMRVVPENVKDMPPLPRVWALALRDDIVIIGCADGSLEIASLTRNKLIGIYAQSPIGISHVKCLDDFVCVARLDGSVEFLKITFETKAEQGVQKIRVQQMRLIRAVRAHQKPVCRMMICGQQLVTASFDRSIKMWEVSSGEMINVLLAHNAPVVNLAADVDHGMLFSSCEEGIICWWNLKTGELIRSIDNNYAGSFQLATSSDYLLGFFGNTQLFLWNRETGQLACRVTEASNDGFNEDSLCGSDGSGIVSFGDIAATASSQYVTFWDLKHRAIIRKVEMSSTVGAMKRLNSKSVLCVVGNTMHSVNVPVARIK